jgi:RNA polymerase subunit RPABC4/transcription elongation factor Spt4
MHCPRCGKATSAAGALCPECAARRTATLRLILLGAVGGVLGCLVAYLISHDVVATILTAVVGAAAGALLGAAGRIKSVARGDKALATAHSGREKKMRKWKPQTAEQKACSECHELNNRNASVCKRCGAKLG